VCRDSGSISQVRFSDITLSTRYSHPSWWGAAAPIYVTALPRAPGGQVSDCAASLSASGWRLQGVPGSAMSPAMHVHRQACSPVPLQVGCARDVRFVNIRATSENGIFLVGGPLPGGGTRRGGSHRTRSRDANGSWIEGQRRRRDLQQPQQHGLQRQQRQSGRYSVGGISLERVQLRLKRRSSWPGGCQDYRPSINITQSSGWGAREGSGWWPAGLDCSSGRTAAVWVAGAPHVVLADVQVGAGLPPVVAMPGAVTGCVHMLSSPWPAHVMARNWPAPSALLLTSLSIPATCTLFERRSSTAAPGGPTGASSCTLMRAAPMGSGCVTFP
jgi:hypothetical protein